MRLAFLLPLFASFLLAASPTRADEEDAPAFKTRERALLEALYEGGGVPPGRFLVKLDTVALDKQREAVLLLTSALSPDTNSYTDQTLEAELAVVSDGGRSLTVLARESLSAPSGVGDRQASVSTPVAGMKGETVIQVLLGRSSDGEGSTTGLTWFQFRPGTGTEDGVLERLMEAEYTPSSGSGYPHEREAARFDKHPSIHDGYSDLSLTIRGSYCETDEDCREEKRVRRVCWMGTRYASDSDCVVRHVTASSQLKSSKAASPTYDPGNVRDGESSTAWCEGAKGTGRGEWLEFDFHTPVTVQALTLVTGYDKSPEVWRNNARLKRVRLHFSNGTHQDADLDDATSPQAIRLQTKSAIESVKLEVLAVYPGRRYPDACVSEVDFSGVKAVPVDEE